MKTNRDRLNRAFSLMRKSGLIARQRFSCCGGCASYELGEALKDRPRKMGAAYYHRQDAGWLDKGGDSVFIGFGAREGSLATDVQVGELVKACAEQAGLAVEWTGSANTRVEILLPGGIDAEVK